MLIKNKIINHLTITGKKNTGEKLLLNSVKKLQKQSKKQSKEILKLIIISSTPIFKLHQITNKKLKSKNRKIKEIPTFITGNKRTSLAIKFIIKSINKQKTKSFSNKLIKEVLNNFKIKGLLYQHKNELQKRVILNKYYLMYYKWN